MTVAARVGTGNIVGVATAIAAGGPGAVFWMWVMAILGAATSFAENTLAQVYKEKVDGMYRGGTSFFVKKGTWPWMVWNRICILQPFELWHFAYNTAELHC